MTSKVRMGLFAICTLVALRFGIGWHFLNEGSTKLRYGFSSAAFLSAAKGPFAEFFQGFVWDADGRVRLGHDREPGINQDGSKNEDQLGRPTINIRPTIAAWEEYREMVNLVYEYDDRQKRLAQARFDIRIKQLKTFFNDNREDIIKYFNGLDRKDNQESNASFSDVDTLKGQAAKLRADLKKDLPGWLSDLRLITNSYQADLLAIATEDQRDSVATPAFEPYEKTGMNTDFVDWFIPRMDLAIGILLITGLFVRIVASVGALFLLSVIVTQWPGTPGAQPVFNQFVEALAMVVLVATAAGRYAGLDGVLRHLLARCCPPKTGTK